MKIKEKVIDCFTFLAHLSLCRLSFFHLFSSRRRRHLRVQGPEKKVQLQFTVQMKIYITIGENSGVHWLG